MSMTLLWTLIGCNLDGTVASAFSGACVDLCYDVLPFWRTCTNVVPDTLDLTCFDRLDELTEAIRAGEPIEDLIGEWNSARRYGPCASPSELTGECVAITWPMRSIPVFCSAFLVGCITLDKTYDDGRRIAGGVLLLTGGLGGGERLALRRPTAAPSILAAQPRRSGRPSVEGRVGTLRGASGRSACRR